MKQHIRLVGTFVLLALLVAGANESVVHAAFSPPLAAAPRSGVAVVPATHERSAQIRWQAVGTNTAQVVVTAGMRRSFYTPLPNVGDSIAYAWINFGDGFQSASTQFTVTYVDVANDVIVAQKIETHTYPSTGLFITSVSSVGRPPQVNNPNLDWRVETLVDFLGTTAGPVTTMPPIVTCPQSGLCSFVVPASDPDNQQMRFRLATPAEAGDARFVQPGLPQAPHAASIDPDTGLYTWDTHGAKLMPTGPTYYSTQVMIDNLNVPGFVVSKTPVDFLIQLVP